MTSLEIVSRMHLELHNAYMKALNNSPTTPYTREQMEKDVVNILEFYAKLIDMNK